MTIFGKLGIAMALGSMTVATVMPAQAQAQREHGWNRGGDRSWNGNRGWNRGRGNRGWDLGRGNRGWDRGHGNRGWDRGRGNRNRDNAAAGAVLGGLFGLGIGAAIASSARDRHDGPRGYAYDAPPRVTYGDGYYNDAPPPPRGYYDQAERWDY
ncbi:hypothetical protein LK533_16375 [Sphingomonas sp. PL-96]|uniref:hypothetical protein n=1 Tax=Sphingomonas sp. PL-96 TaxID=2887201 RepID=UPI001E5C556A|nr:hypothetical protein [Sphingomonas sp. PL-96]MCC2978237.1 hypothetical protein [Sphingomonas sp. PL-96]